LNGGLGLLVSAIPGLLETKSADKLFLSLFSNFFQPLESPIDTNEYHFLDADYPSPQGREFSWRKSRELARKKAAPSRRTSKRFARNSDP
jgi:hypothetical protein